MTGFGNIVFTGIALAVVIIVVVFVYRRGRSVGRREGREDERKETDAINFREILSRDQEIQELRTEINSLNELNSRYLSFMFKISTTVQRLNSTMKFEDIILSIVHLVRDVIPTDIVQIYMYDAQDGLLRRVSIYDDAGTGKDSYAMGEGLVGLAAQDRIVRVDGRGFSLKSKSEDSDQSEMQIWMATPIVFNERMLGVIGVGKPKNPTGNESNLMKMIADIAAVALVNQAIMGEAKHRANTDSLTGLNNRNYFFQMAQTFIERAIREATPISIFLFDIDNFKNYNDTNGHDAGDRLLIELSQLVSGITRKTAVFARYGGEEFIVMLPGISKEEAFIYGDRVREKVAAHPFLNREKQPLGCVSISGGVANFPIDGDSLYKVIQLADASLYQAKSEGRNRVLLHKPYHFSEKDEEIVERNSQF